MVVFAIISRVLGLIWRVKAFKRPVMPVLTRNKSLSSENNSMANGGMTSEGVCTGSVLPDASREHAVDENSRYSGFHFSAFSSSGIASSVFSFAPILLRSFYSLPPYMGENTLLQIFNFDLRKTFCVIKADLEGHNSRARYCFQKISAKNSKWLDFF